MKKYFFLLCFFLLNINLIYTQENTDNKETILSIITFPEGYEVFINGVKNKDITPINIRDINNEFLMIQLVKKGCKPINKDITIKKNEINLINVTDRNCSEYNDEDKEVKSLKKDEINYNIKDYKNYSQENKNVIRNLKKPQIEYVQIPLGIFNFGSPENEPFRSDNEKQQKITLNTFKISKYEITFDEFDVFCEATGRIKPVDEGWGRGKRPVINISHEDALEFAKWIGARLPNEAEWEYATRAGVINSFFTGDDLKLTQANFKGNEINKTLEVGSYKSNNWGLYDMIGNVKELVIVYKDNLNNISNFENEKNNYNEITIRGCSWNSDINECRSAKRFENIRNYKNNEIGFRVVEKN